MFKYLIKYLNIYLIENNNEIIKKSISKKKEKDYNKIFNYYKIYKKLYCHLDLLLFHYLQVVLEYYFI